VQLAPLFCRVGVCTVRLTATALLYLYQHLVICLCVVIGFVLHLHTLHERALTDVTATAAAAAMCTALPTPSVSHRQHHLINGEIVLQTQDGHHIFLLMQSDSSCSQLMLLLQHQFKIQLTIRQRLTACKLVLYQHQLVVTMHTIASIINVLHYTMEVTSNQ